MFLGTLHSMVLMGIHQFGGGLCTDPQGNYLLLSLASEFI